MTTFPTLRGKSIDDVAPLDRLSADLALLYCDGRRVDGRKSLAGFRLASQLDADAQEAERQADAFLAEIQTRLRGWGWSERQATIWTGIIADRACAIALEMDEATGAGSPWP